MDDVESGRVDNSPPPASERERKRTRRKATRNRPTSSTQPSHAAAAAAAPPPHATSATVFKSSSSNAASRPTNAQRTDDRSDGEEAVSQPVASSSKSPRNVEAPPPTNGATSSSASSEEDNAVYAAASATPPHKRRKKKKGSSPVEMVKPSATSAPTAIPHLGGARARMMAQDQDREMMRRAQQEQEDSTQETSLAPAASTSSAAMNELEKSLVDARQARAEVDAELTRLRQEMSFKNEVIAAQSSALSYLHTQATCTICLELAWRPHVLSPCGHIFCARCLVDWFKRPLPDEQPAPSWMRGDELRAYEEESTQRRKKICPSCRTKVVGPPAEVWSLKGCVDRLHSAQLAGYMAGVDGGEHNFGAAVERTPEEEAQLRGEDLVPGAALWKPIFDENGARRRIFDEGDLIWRCGHCTGEIAWGECQNCHRTYTMTDDGDEEDDPDGLLYSDEYSDEYEEDEGDVNDMLDHLARGYRIDNAHGGHDEDQDEEEEEANSFIVSDADSANLGYSSDDNGSIPVIEDDFEQEHETTHHYAGPPRRRHGYSDEDESDDDGASSSSIESGSAHHHQMAAQHNRRRLHPRRLAIDDDEEDEDEDGDEDNVSTMLDGPSHGHSSSSSSSSTRGMAPRGRRRLHFDDLTDEQSEGDESGSEGEIADVIDHGSAVSISEDEDLQGHSDDQYASDSEDDGDASNVSRFGHHGGGSTRGGGVRGVSPVQRRGRYLVVSDSEEEEDGDDGGRYHGGRGQQPRAGGSRYDVDSEDSEEPDEDGEDDEENLDYEDEGY